MPKPKFTEKATCPVSVNTSAASVGEVRYRDDAYLRLHRFVIHSRPPDGPNLWVRDGKVHREDIAYRLCRLEDAADDRRHKGMKGGL